MVATVLINVPLVYVGGLCAAGFLVGATVPLSVAQGNNMMPGYSGAVSSLLTFASVVGLLFFPWLIGVIAETSGFWYGIALTALFPCAIAVLSAFLPRPR